MSPVTKLAPIMMVGMSLLPAQGTEAPPPEDRRESVSPASDFAPLARMVGQIVVVIPAEGGGSITLEVCSGLVITERQILTARHCFRTQVGGELPYTAALFRLGLTQQELKIYELFHDAREDDEDNDFVVMESKEDIAEFRPELLKLSDVDVADDQDLFLLHYPGPGSVVLTRMDCKTASPSAVGSSLHHLCDTEPGSSGAPMFDNEMNLVGMHQQGGRGSDPKSFNSGISITGLLKGSLVKAALDAASKAAPGKSLQEKTEFEYTLLTTGQVIFKKGEGWSVKSAAGAVTPLVEQADDDNAVWTFWHPALNVLFRWPTKGGNFESKSTDPAAKFVVIDKATLLVGPKK